MRLRPFELLQPISVGETVEMLGHHVGETKLLAGGTDLLVVMGHGKVRPGYLVSLNKVREMCGIRRQGDGSVRLGAGTTHHELEISALIRQSYLALAEGAALVGSPQIRRVGTVAGNVCHASPAADTAPALAAFGARVRIAGPQGAREVPITAFWIGPGKTSLQPDELVTELALPELPNRSGSSFQKLGIRGAMEISIVSAAVVVTLAPDSDVCQEARIALGAVAPTVIRVARAEEALRGQPLDDRAIEEAARLAAEESKPISDVRASASYRREMVRVMTRRALHAARGRVGSRQ